MTGRNYANGWRGELGKHGKVDRKNRWYGVRRNISGVEGEMESLGVATIGDVSGNW